MRNKLINVHTGTRGPARAAHGGTYRRAPLSTHNSRTDRYASKKGPLVTRTLARSHPVDVYGGSAAPPRYPVHAAPRPPLG